MAEKSAFISFDYDNDKAICGSLRAQSEDSKVAFNISDWSLKEPVTEKWKDKVRDIIRRVDLTIVLCGEHTDTAAGVAAEVAIAREEGKPYFLLRGYKHKRCKKPGNALKTDEMYEWTQKNLKKLIFQAG